MAESMAGLKRSCRCTEVTEANVGQELTLTGKIPADPFRIRGSAVPH